MFHYFLGYILKPAPPAELQQFFDLLPAALHCRFVEGISEERGTEGPAVKRSGGFREKRGGYNGLGKSYVTHSCRDKRGWFPLFTMIPVRQDSEVFIIYPGMIKKSGSTWNQHTQANTLAEASDGIRSPHFWGWNMMEPNKQHFALRDYLHVGENHVWTPTEFSPTHKKDKKAWHSSVHETPWVRYINHVHTCSNHLLFVFISCRFIPHNFGSDVLDVPSGFLW